MKVVCYLDNVSKRESFSAVFVDGKKIKLVDISEWDNLTALSNRRLSSQNLGIDIKLHWSIDRITVVGETRLFDRVLPDGTTKIYDFSNIFEVLVLHKRAEETPKGWKILDEYGENIAYAEELEHHKGKARIDFNPNKLGRFIETDLKDFFSKILKNAHFSRADVACDIIDIPDDYISQYTITSDVKSIRYHSRTGQLQTAYWGSRSSERQVRMYNKLIEQRQKGKVIPEEVSSWWRLELQLRRDKANNWSNIVRDSLSEFCSPFFFPEDLSGTDRVMMTGLFADNTLWSAISKNSRTKYKQIQKRIAKEDALTNVLSETFEEEVSRLNNELEFWLMGMNIVE